MASFKEQTSPLLQDLQLAMMKQGKKKFSGKSEDELVEIRVSGKHEVIEVQLADLGLSKKREEALVRAIKEATNAAIEKAQRSAVRDIKAGTKGEARSKK